MLPERKNKKHTHKYIRVYIMIILNLMIHHFNIWHADLWIRYKEEIKIIEFDIR